MTSPEQFERYQRHVMGRFARALDEIDRRNTDADPDEVLREVTAIVEEVRQERYDRRRHLTTDQERE
jgi:hypothetical protein